VLRARALATIRPTLTLEQVGLAGGPATPPSSQGDTEQMEARRKEVKTNLERSLRITKPAPATGGEAGSGDRRVEQEAGRRNDTAEEKDG